MYSEKNYWTRQLSRKARRRQVLRAGAILGSAGAAALLIGCGGDDDEPQGSTGTSTQGTGSTGSSSSQLVSAPIDTTSAAVKGGIYPRAGSADVPSFDVYGGWIQAIHAYSRLLKYQAIKHPDPIRATVVPDAAESWEMSPDALELTLKLRPDMKLDPRPPTNGRILNAQDVKFAWDQFEESAPTRTLLANSASSKAPILSVEVQDDTTIHMTMAFPYAPLLQMLAADRVLHLIPVEAEDKFDMRVEMRGSGAWRLDKVVPSVSIDYVKNPDWYDADKVNFDGIRDISVGEYAAGLVQFRAGEIWTYDVSDTDMLQTKRDFPELLMQQKPQFPISSNYIRFSYRPDSPFLDERVRQAISMLIDRDQAIRALRNTKNFESAGLDMSIRWHTAVPAGEDDFWLDPKGADFGESAKFYQFNPDEAKKLLSAAGQSGLETILTWGQTGDVERVAEIMQGMLEENGGLKVEAQVLDYPSVIRPNYLNGGDQHEGIFTGTSATYPDVDGFLSIWYESGQERTGHVDAQGNPDAHLDDLLNKQRSEFDFDERVAIIHDFQRYTASKMYLMHHPGDVLGFELAWPWLGNWNVYRSKSMGTRLSDTQGCVQEGFIYEWYDQSKK